MHSAAFEASEVFDGKEGGKPKCVHLMLTRARTPPYK